jgi:hypothetical protein
MKTYVGRRYSSTILNLGTRRRWVVAAALPLEKQPNRLNTAKAYWSIPITNSWCCIMNGAGVDPMTVTLLLLKTEWERKRSLYRTQKPTIHSETDRSKHINTSYAKYSLNKETNGLGQRWSVCSVFGRHPVQLSVRYIESWEFRCLPQNLRTTRGQGPCYTSFLFHVSLIMLHNHPTMYRLMLLSEYWRRIAASPVLTSSGVQNAFTVIATLFAIMYLQDFRIGSRPNLCI